MKKIICYLMSLILVVSTFAGMDMESLAGTNGVTQEQAGVWAEAQNGKSLDQDGYYGAQCVDLIRYYYLYLGNSPVQGNGCDYATNALPSGWQRIRYYNGFVPQRGDIAVWTYTTSAYGHVAIVTNANSSMFYVVEQNGSTHVTRMWSYNYSYGTLWGFIRPDFATPQASEPTGSEMTSGYARTIPDGDYVIASALGKFYLDILGSSTPEAEGSKIQLHECNGFWTDIPVFDVWTLKYNFDGFYSIYQKGTNVSLDVPNASVANRTALQVWNANNSAAQKWAIHDLGNGTCTIQAKCSGYAVDVRNAVAANETVIQQNVVNESAAQQWRFIPYKPTVTESNKVASATYNGHEYILYKKLMTWNDARDWCKNQGGNLVTITSSGEQNAVESLMSKVSNRIWLGASDAESEGNWKWVTGEIFNYSNWGSGEPNNNPASYGGYENFMELSATGTWNDVEEYVKTIEYFILEKTHTHTSNSGTITTQPTCTQTGVKTYKCTTCGATVKTETVAALGHNYTSTVTTQPTCTAEGVKTYKCSRCTSSYTEKISALGHTDLDENGNCTRCGAHIKDVVNPDACPYCGQVHDGIFGWIVAFFHKVIYLIDQLF